MKIVNDNTYVLSTDKYNAPVKITKTSKGLLLEYINLNNGDDENYIYLFDGKQIAELKLILDEYIYQLWLKQKV